jgi:hypothetical protein
MGESTRLIPQKRFYQSLKKHLVERGAIRNEKLN